MFRFYGRSCRKLMKEFPYVYKLAVFLPQIGRIQNMLQIVFKGVNSYHSLRKITLYHRNSRIISTFGIISEITYTYVRMKRRRLISYFLKTYLFYIYGKPFLRF